MQTDRKLTHSTGKASKTRQQSVSGLVLCLSIVASTGVAMASTAFHPIADISEAAGQYARSLSRELNLINPRINVSSIDSRLRLKRCLQPLDATAELRQPSRIQHVSIAISCANPPWKLYVPVRVDADSATVTLTKAMSRGSVITGQDVQLTHQQTAHRAVPMLSAVSDAIGLELTRDLPAGAILTTGLVRKPFVVRRGDLVSVTVDRHGLRVTTMGEARQDGTIGQMIPVKNPRSNRIIEGKIQPDGSITVM